MKKFLLLIAFALVALVGCKTGEMYPLDGTVWKGGVELDPINKTAATLSFFQTTFHFNIEKMVNGSVETEKTEGTYMYNHPRISMTVAGHSDIATVTDNKITFKGYTLTRQ